MGSGLTIGHGVNNGTAAAQEGISDNLHEAVQSVVKEKVDFFFSLKAVRDIMQSGDNGRITELYIATTRSGDIETAIKQYGTAAEIEAIDKRKLEGYRCAHIDFLTWIEGYIATLPDKAPKAARESLMELCKNAIINQLSEERDEYTENGIADLLNRYTQLLNQLMKFIPRDSGQNFINQSPATHALVKRETGEIFLGTNPENGEVAIMTLLSGYLKPYEKEILECISKFKLEGQVTENNKIWFTLGQLYKALRHGAGTSSPQAEQKEALLNALIELSNDSRKITFKLNDYLRVWGGFETNGGRLRIIGFDELYGKIRGQEDILIMLDNTPLICAIAENLKMFEVIGQEVKAIQQRRYTLTLKKTISINGKAVKKRSFASNEERVKFCKKYGVTKAQIETHEETSKPWKLSENRIALRAVILDFVYRYIRARSIGRNHSNKLPYKTIFERCEIDVNTRVTVKRVKDDIAVILTHLVNCEGLPELKSWSEYKNKGSKQADGVKISLQLAKEG